MIWKYFCTENSLYCYPRYKMKEKHAEEGYPINFFASYNNYSRCNRRDERKRKKREEFVVVTSKCEDWARSCIKLRLDRTFCAQTKFELQPSFLHFYFQNFIFINRPRKLRNISTNFWQSVLTTESMMSMTH